MVAIHADLSDHLDDLARAWAQLMAPPPPPVPLLEFAGQFTFTEGPAEGEIYDPTSHPGQYFFLLAYGGGLGRTFRHFVVLAPTQDGKTWCFIVAAFCWVLFQLRKPVAYAAPDMNICGKTWRNKIRPMVQRSPYADLLPCSGVGGSGGSKPEDVTMANGVIAYFLGAGASNEAGQSSVTAWSVWKDERDSIPPRRAKLLDRRMEGYIDGQTLSTSTVKPAHGGSGVVADYKRSTHGVLEHRCPHCGHWQTWEWERVTYDATSDAIARATAGIACEGCSVILDEDEWRESCTLAHTRLAMGEMRISVAPDGSVDITGESSDSEIYGERWTSLDSPLKSLGNLVVEHRAASAARREHGNDEALAQFCRDHLAREWTGGARTIAVDRVALAARSATAVYRRGEAPPAVDAHIGALFVDVQWRRLFWLLQAVSATDERAWIIDYGQVPVCGEGEDATTEQYHAALSRIEARAWQGWGRADGSILRPHIAGVDIADGHTCDAVCTWLAARPGWNPCRGEDDRRPTADAAAGTAKYRMPGWLAVYHQAATEPPRDEFHIAVDPVRSAVYRGLRRGLHEKSAVLLPQGEAADGDLIRHLCGYRYQEIKPAVYGWVKIARRHDYADCLVDGRALAQYVLHRQQAERERTKPDPVAVAAAMARTKEQ